MSNFYGLNFEDTREPLENKEPQTEHINQYSILRYEDKPYHKLFEGDNLLTLNHLTETHNKKVDVIYIDPPYNTGNKEFVYNDHYVDKDDEYRHSKWLSFMRRRLKLAHQLLSDNGVIYISIDDNEMAHLKLLCDSIFGEDNFVTTFSWIASNKEASELEEDEQIKTLGANLGMIKQSHEYILCYRKTKEFKFNLVPSDNPYIDSRLTKKGNQLNDLRIPAGTQCEKPITKTFTGIIGGKSEPIEVLNDNGMVFVDGVLQEDVTLRSCFANHNMANRFFSGEEVIDRRGQKLVSIYFKPTGIPYMRKEKQGEIPTNVLSGYGDTSKWRKHLTDLLGEHSFDYPKPYPLIKHLISIGSSKDSIVLDFFAGSGTTGHAVMELNAEDNGNRSFILATNNEVSLDKEIKFLIDKGYIESKPKRKSDIKVWDFELDKFKQSDEYTELIKTTEYQSLGIARFVTHRRLDTLINGYTFKGKKVDGLKSNLNYIKVTSTPK